MVEIDQRLAHIQSQVNIVRADINEVHGGIKAISSENPELPRIRTEIERLLNRLVPALERLEATADSLGAMAAGLRGAADIVDQLNDEDNSTVGIRNAADKIDRAMKALKAPQVRVDAVTSAKTVQLTQKLVSLATEVVANSDLLTEGLAISRKEIEIARKGTFEYRDKIVYWVYVAAFANTLIWIWCGLGQLCLMSWGHRRYRSYGEVIFPTPS